MNIQENRENHQAFEVFEKIHYLKNSRLYRTFEFYTNNSKVLSFFKHSFLLDLIRFRQFSCETSSTILFTSPRLSGLFLIQCFQTLDFIKAISLSVGFNWGEYGGMLIHQISRSLKNLSVPPFTWTEELSKTRHTLTWSMNSNSIFVFQISFINFLNENDLMVMLDAEYLLFSKRKMQ